MPIICLFALLLGGASKITTATTNSMRRKREKLRAEAQQKVLTGGVSPALLTATQLELKKEHESLLFSPEDMTRLENLPGGAEVLALAQLKTAVQGAFGS